MPELPEVETLRRDLEQEVVGRRISHVEVTGMRSTRRHPDPAVFVSRLEGATITGVDRKGKYVLVVLDEPGTLVVHLGMSGQLLVVRSPEEPPCKHCHVRITLTPASQLRYVDPRTFGELFVTARSFGQASGETGEGEEGKGELPELAHLGLDPLGPALNPAQLAELLHRRRVKLKALLMDQRFLAGIGNIYSDEILFAAGLRYDRSSASLSLAEVHRLHAAMVETLQSAIERRGSSLADAQYRDLFGQVGGYQHLHQVYARAGQPCRRCRSAIVRVKAAGRSSFYCERCQR